MVQLRECDLTLIEITNICDLECVYCAKRSGQRPLGIMSLSNFVHVLTQLARRWGKDALGFRIALHGFGEPSCIPQFDHYLEVLEEYGFNNVDLTSNGYRLDRIVPALLDHQTPLSWVRVSLPSAFAHIAEQLCPGMTFSETVQNIRLLIDAKPDFRLVVQHHICDETRGEKEDLYREILGTKGWHYATKVLHDACGQGEDVRPRRPCTEGYGSRLVIHWNGDLVGCCTDNTNRQVYGNAFSDGIYAPRTLERRHAMAEAYQNKQFDELPLCKGAL